MADKKDNKSNVVCPMCTQSFDFKMRWNGGLCCSYQCSVQIERECQKCGNSYIRMSDATHGCCSALCLAEHETATNAVMTCPHCKKNFHKKTRYNGGRCCSKECSTKLQRNCAHCLHLFTRESGLTEFCSTACGLDSAAARPFY